LLGGLDNVTGLVTEICGGRVGCSSGGAYELLERRERWLCSGEDAGGLSVVFVWLPSGNGGPVQCAAADIERIANVHGRRRSIAVTVSGGDGSGGVLNDGLDSEVYNAAEGKKPRLRVPKARCTSW
jgi:hypothetical protein